MWKPRNKPLLTTKLTNRGPHRVVRRRHHRRPLRNRHRPRNPRRPDLNADHQNPATTRKEWRWGGQLEF